MRPSTGSLDPHHCHAFVPSRSALRSTLQLSGGRLLKSARDSILSKLSFFSRSIKRELLKVCNETLHAQP